MTEEYYTKEQVEELIDSFKKFLDENNYQNCGYKLPDLKPFRVSLLGFRHKEDKIFLEITEKHLDDIEIK